MLQFRSSWFTDRAIQDCTLHAVVEVLMDLALGGFRNASMHRHALHTMVFQSIVDGDVSPVLMVLHQRGTKDGQRRTQTFVGDVFD